MNSIVTFYSYKGGVGRTMALANIAVLLARKGLRVLAVDWDLEAPGLERYFRDYTIYNNNEQVGLLDLLIAAKTSAPNQKPDWHNYLSHIDFGYKHPLHLLMSGQRDKEYASQVLSFDWNAFFEYSEGGDFVESLRNEWRDEFDVTLIDSRTGITDAGGICTIQMPDILVPVFTTNDLSLQGAKEIALRAKKAQQKLAFDRMGLLVFPLPSHYDDRTQYEEAKQWLKKFAQELAPFYEDWLPKQFTPLQIIERTKLLYIAYFSFGEKLPVVIEGTSDIGGLGYAYLAAATLIGSDFKEVERLLADELLTSSHRDKAVVKQYELAIVAVEDDYHLPFGTGFFVPHNNGVYVVTSAYPIRKLGKKEGDTVKLRAFNPSFKELPEAEIIWYQVSNDEQEIDTANQSISILKLKDSLSLDLPLLPLNESEYNFLDYRRNDDFLCFGYPGSKSTMGSWFNKFFPEGVVGHGFIELSNQGQYEFDTGISGAPLCHVQTGTIIGMIRPFSGNIAYMIPSTTIIEILSQLPQAKL
jgi:hypothetical protein